MISKDGEYSEQILGMDFENGQKLQFVVPKDTIFGSSRKDQDGFSLVTCVVVPGFDWEDFELFKREDLLSKFPQHSSIIRKLTFN